jgi:hypothetical protein
MLTIGQLNRIYELEELLNNCVDDDKAILYERELEGLEEMNEKKKEVL